MSTRYTVRYAILPPGTGPDDYESKDLVHKEEEFELPDPGLEHPKLGRLGPTILEIRTAVSEKLAEGEEPIILDVRPV